MFVISAMNCFFIFYSKTLKNALHKRNQIQMLNRKTVPENIKRCLTIAKK